MDEIFSPSRTVEKIVLYVGLMIGLAPANKIITQLMYTLSGKTMNILYNDFHKLIIGTICDADYECLENPATHDLQRNAEAVAYGNGDGFCKVVERIFELGGNLITFIGIAAIIFTLTPILIVFLLLLILLNSWMRSRCNKAEFRLRKGRVTHRLASVRFCDDILVFENGSVTARGTHAELVAQNGIYAEMFEKQAVFYESSGS